MHSKAIEAAARAIAASDTNPDSGIKCLWHVESYRNTVTKHAQAAIAAYLAAMEAGVPTEAMIDAGVEVAGMPISSVVPQGEDADRYMVRLICQNMLAARPNVKG